MLLQIFKVEKNYFSIQRLKNKVIEKLSWWRKCQRVEKKQKGGGSQNQALTHRWNRWKKKNLYSYIKRIIINCNYKKNTMKIG